MAKSKIDVSVIITAHKEGILAHKTMLSVLRSAKKLEDKNVSYEIIVHIDNGSPETEQYFSRYSDDPRVRVLKNRFGDLSESRNYSAEQASGKYISFIDADDLYSELWLISAYNLVCKSDNTVARLNYIITFGSGESVVTKNRQLSDNDKMLHLIDSNMYGSPMMCNRDVYLDTPQRPNRQPYGSEDWQWIMDTLAKGVKHEIAPQTALFYRKDPLSNPSLLASQSLVRSTLSISESLSFNSIKQLTIPDEHYSYDIPRDLQARIKRRLKHELKSKSYHTARYIKSFKSTGKIARIAVPAGTRSRIAGWLAYKWREIDGIETPLFSTHRPIINLPDWLIDEWKEINKIEKLTFPTDSTLKRLVAWSPNKEAGVGYARIVKQLRKKPDTLFFVPWLIRGGADKVFINTANELAEAHPEWNIAMFQTLYHPSVWQSKLSDKVDFVDIAMNLRSLGYEHQLRLMAMFLVQNDIKRILIGNSKFAYDLLLRYKKLFTELDIKVYAFAFTELIDPDGRITDYIHEDLPLVEDTVYRIVTDNTSIVDQLDREHGISKEKVHVHHQYLNNEFRKPESRDSRPVKVMWASRVARQKVPEVLLEIGKKVSQDFQIDVYGDIEIHYSKSFFDESNVNYIRGFNGINDLPVDDYDVFLYTSSADGMPNMLLEIGSKGLPIIAPNVGGVSDFIKNEETGLLIDDYRDSSAYVEALEKLKNRDFRQSLAESAQKLLKSEFTEKKWKKVIREIFDK